MVHTAFPSCPHAFSAFTSLTICNHVAKAPGACDLHDHGSLKWTGRLLLGGGGAVNAREPDPSAAGRVLTQAGDQPVVCFQFDNAAAVLASVSAMLDAVYGRLARHRFGPWAFLLCPIFIRSRVSCLIKVICRKEAELWQWQT